MNYKLSDLVLLVGNSNILNNLANLAKTKEFEITQKFCKKLLEYDLYTFYHSVHVCKYSLWFTKFYPRFRKYEVEILYSSLLHDIGKLLVPKRIISKQGFLNAAEFNVIKQHPLYGADLLEQSFYLTKAIENIRYHHENIDGSGYPCGLRGKEIPLVARMLRIVDSFDAMTTNRCYQKEKTVFAALAEIEKNLGILYDEEIGLLFINLFKNYSANTSVIGG